MKHPADFIVCWSGVLEKTHQAPGLASPLVPSTAAAAMRQAGRFHDLTIKFPPKRQRVCPGCGKAEYRVRFNRKQAFCPYTGKCKACRLESVASLEKRRMR